ncbi:hypothetical protein E2562_015283 [Oryza meyeriana var. granulata]|uniref:Uncharacterized protein n=1 Tax=Oryza meyeriana var. granulata TaxID=110450 RepID=A0A6G1DKE4_9ORYZ|nr:hypothetical protein E2562_015283 [Oryza meyeriana var. granulata]
MFPFGSTSMPPSNKMSLALEVSYQIRDQLKATATYHLGEVEVEEHRGLSNVRLSSAAGVERAVH